MSGNASRPERLGISISSKMISTSLCSRCSRAVSLSGASQTISICLCWPSTRAKMERATTLSSTSMTRIGATSGSGVTPDSWCVTVTASCLYIQPTICSLASSVSRSNGFITYSSAPASIAALMCPIPFSVVQKMTFAKGDTTDDR